MKTVTASGGNMYRLALQYLGDATQWNRIAQANFGPNGGPPPDPVIDGVVMLNIPSANPLLTGGVLVV
jgi:hypothetical protein